MAIAAGEHVAEPDGDVRVHHDAPRRLFRVDVRQRPNQLVGIRLRGPLGQFVDEPELRAALGAVLLVHRPALRALAVVVPVHLREIVLAEARMVLHSLEHPLGDDFEHLRVGQTKLRLLADPLTVDLGEILGVLVEELVGADVAEVGVARAVEGVLLAERIVLAAAARVAPPAAAKLGVAAGPGVAGLAPSEAGLDQPVGLLDHDVLVPRRLRCVRRVPPHAQHVLEEVAHSVERSGTRRARDYQVRLDRPQHEALLAELLVARVNAQRGRDLAASDDDHRAVAAGHSHHDRQLHARRRLEIRLQLLGRVLLRRAGRLFQHDSASTLAVPQKHDLRGGRRECAQRRGKHHDDQSLLPR